MAAIKKRKYGDTALPFLTKTKNISKTKLARHWSDAYKQDVKRHKKFWEEDDPCKTTQRNYDEFDEWMYELLVYRHNQGRSPLWDFGSSEDRMYYRSYAIAKGIHKNIKLNINDKMDDPFMTGVVCDWFVLGVIDTNTFLSCINGQPAFDTGDVIDWNPRTKRWSRNKTLSKWTKVSKAVYPIEYQAWVKNKTRKKK